MIIDTHIHERRHSGDSEMCLEDIVLRAKKIGLEGLCITDHESQGIMEFAEEYGRKEGIPIIVGAEILTFEGDITVFGLERLPEKMIHAQELLDMVKLAKGVGICAHPFRENNRGLGHRARKLTGLSGIEVFNGSTPLHHNISGYNMALECGLNTFGASDAHVIEKLGKYATSFPGTVRDLKDFIEAVKVGGVSPAVLTENGYKIIEIVSTETVEIYQKACCR